MSSIDPSDYPSNTHADKEAMRNKKVEQITSSAVVRKKRPRWSALREVFIAGSLRGSFRWVVSEIVLPGVRDMIWEAGSEGWRSLILGEGRRRSAAAAPPGGVSQFAYNRMSQPGTPYHMMTGAQRVMSRVGRARHNFDEIVLTSRTEAADVIDRLFELLQRYDQVSVAELYTLVGITPNHTDHKWGWTNLQGAGPTPTREGGFLLDLPEPHPL